MSIGKNFAGVIAFMKVAASGSFSEAARELGISVPAVSRSVSRLEAQLNIKLLERTTHRVAVTPEGRCFFESCLPSVEHLLKATAELKNSTQLPAGTVRINSTVGFGRSNIAPLLHGFKKIYPEIQLEFDLNDRHVDFSEGRVDVAIRNGRLEDADIIARQLLPMQLITCGSPDYLSAAGLPVTLDDLQHHDIVAFRLEKTGKPHDWEFDVGGAFTQISLPYNQLFNDPELVALATIAGGGLAQIGSYQAENWIEKGLLVPVMPQYIAQGRGHFICYRRREKTPLRVKLFVDYIVDAFKPKEPVSLL
ncbi:LysR family transcriptional regulator [Pseudomonas fluorescens]|uniref:LysR family transcriptional regulator n=1 Tax=Pseudomonas fluorescens TaxID=294 RepID=UPI002ACA706A|nr:LysR family transcriptional regulator [Pseudomonas fluorescens]MDZ5431354.1 LysR family transcriptional regulator [Pseudomonas fluorescens]